MHPHTLTAVVFAARLQPASALPYPSAGADTSSWSTHRIICQIQHRPAALAEPYSAGMQQRALYVHSGSRQVCLRLCSWSCSVASLDAASSSQIIDESVYLRQKRRLCCARRACRRRRRSSDRRRRQAAEGGSNVRLQQCDMQKSENESRSRTLRSRTGLGVHVTWKQMDVTTEVVMPLNMLPS